MGGAAPLLFCFCALCPFLQDGPHEVNEGSRQGHDQGSFSEGHCGGAWLEGKGVLAGRQQLGRYCNQGGEEDRPLHCARFVPHQDPRETSNKGRNQKHLWKRSQSVGEASKDSREGLPGACFEEADLSGAGCLRLMPSQRSFACGNPMKQAWEVLFRAMVSCMYTLQCIEPWCVLSTYAGLV